MTPPLPYNATRLERHDRIILAALLSGERQTMRDLAALTGRSLTTTRSDLLRLRRGLIDWEPHKAATLRAVVGVV